MKTLDEITREPISNHDLVWDADGMPSYWEKVEVT